MSWRNSRQLQAETLEAAKKGRIFCVFDTETTGLGKDAKIIQFSAQIYKIREDLGFELLSEFDQYINPEEPLQEKIVELTGINDFVLSHFGPERDYAENIFAYLNRADFLLAKNSPFDLRMLQQMQDRLGTSYTLPPCLDVEQMARDAVPTEKVVNYKLATLVEYMYPDLRFEYHSAIEDVKATAYVFQYCLCYYRRQAVVVEAPKLKVHVEWANCSVNPHAASQQRIKVCIDKEKRQYGDIYFDVVRKAWDCKKTKEAQKLFSSVDLQDLERQVMQKYAWRFGASTMPELASAWMKEKRNNKKEAAQ